MKNFTNNFKQFTSRLSARWLIMALMLLVGTSSAWASTVYFINSLGWTDIKIYYWGNISVDWGASPSMTKESYQINGSDVYKYTFNTDPQNIIFRGSNVQTVDIAFSAGKQWTPNDQWDNGKAKGSWSTYTPPCTKSVSGGSGRYSNGEITLSAVFNTCGNAYIGFQWKEKNAQWCYENGDACYIALNQQNKQEETVTTTVSKSGASYVFRPYIVDGSDATKWIYGNEFEVTTCSDPSAGYSISNENASVDWDGTEKEVIITTANGYVTPSKIYYDGNETKPTAVGEYTITIDVPSYGTYCAATDLEIGTFTITCPSIAAPAITPSATVCEGAKVTLSSYNGDNTNTVKWYSSQEFNSEVTEQVTLTDDGTKYYAKAYHEASGCYSSVYSTLTFTVNPLPNISISGNNSAVLYEDVELTAATDGTSISWEITEGVGSLSSTTGNSVTLTSSSAGTVTVTATATSADDCTSAVTKTVTFGAENCNDVVVYDNENVEIWLSSSLNTTMYLHRWYENGDQDTGITTWPGAKTTKSDEYYKWTTTSSGNIGYIFHDNTSNNKSSDANKTLEKGYRYYFTFNGGTGGAIFNKSERITTTTPAQITAPAAKTISVSTTDGEGNIIFSGQVVKTGCDATNEYGFQYSLDEQTWTTVKVGENAAAGTAISNNTVKGLDGTYHVRAYITNDNSTQYGAITEITVSTKKTPITSVVLTHVKDVNGTAYEDQELENLTYCVGDEVWFELNYVGSTFIPENNVGFKWTTYPGNGLIGAYNGNKYKFTITGSGTIGIRLRNDANVDGEGNPTWAESNLLEFNTHPVAISPTISFENATICSNSTATLKLGSLVVGQSYELYKEIENEGVYSEERVGDVTLTCNSIEDDLKFTGLNESGKYFVKGYTAQCPDYKASSQTATLEIVDESSVYITLNPTEATTTPWMPVKFTVNASDKYTLNVTKGNPAEAATEAEVSQNGNKVSVKIPLPQGSTLPKGTTDVYGQYENVEFPDGETTQYTITATLSAIGGDDNPCATPANATITLVPYEEECTIGH